MTMRAIRRILASMITGFVLGAPAPPVDAQQPPEPKLYKCTGTGLPLPEEALCGHLDFGGWEEVPPGGEVSVGQALGARMHLADWPAPNQAVDWAWNIEGLPSGYYGYASFSYHGMNIPNQMHLTYSGSHDVSYLYPLVGPGLGAFTARWQFSCYPEIFVFPPGAYSVKFTYRPPHPPLPDEPPPPEVLGNIPFTLTDRLCRALPTTHPDPNNRPPSNAPEAGQEPDAGEEPDPVTACPLVSNPVEVTTGNVFFDQTDFVVPTGGAPFRFTRSYNSKNADTGGVFGPGWTFSYERVLTFPAPGEILLHEGRGAALAFIELNSNGTFSTRRRMKNVNTILRQANGQWRRSFARGGYELFDSYGRLVDIVNAAGDRTHIDRTGFNPGEISAFAGDQYLGSIVIDYENNRPKRLRYNGIVVADYSFYADGTLKTVTYGDQSGFEFTYDPQTKELLQVLDLEGRVLETHTYSDGKALTSEIADGKERYTFEYEPSPTRTVVTDALGHESTYDWSTIGDQTLVTKIAGPCAGCGGGQQIQEWVYDPTTGAVTSYKDGRGKETTYTYYVDTRKLETITRKPDPLTTYTTRYTYHPDGRVHQRFDPNGGLITMTYGPAGPTQISQKVTDTETRTTSIEYHPTYRSNPWRITDPRSKVTELGFSPAFLRTIKDPLDHVTTFDYDALGRRTKVTLPPTIPATEEPTVYYDARGRVRFVVDPGGTADEEHGTCTKCTLYTYDKGGRLTLRKDAYGREVRYGYDPYGRLQDTTQPVVVNGVPTDYVTRFTYDDMSNLQTIEDPRGKITDFDYDAYGRVSLTKYPRAVGETVRQEEFTYYPDGRLMTFKNRKGVTSTIEYDDIGGLKRKTYSDGSPAVNYGYDATGLTSAAYATPWLSWTYDYAGQVRTATDPQGTTVYDYELSGQRKTLTLGTFGLTYQYDDAGRLQFIRRGAREFEFVDDEASRRRGLLYPNGTATEYTPDGLSRLLSTKVSVGPTVLSEIGYTYDDVWNVASKTTAGVPDIYHYDDAYRLTTVDRTTPGVESYRYDPTGNRSGVPHNWTYSDRNELLSARIDGKQVAFTYDLNGNQVRKAPPPGGLGSAWDYEWDVENRLKRALRDQVKGSIHLRSTRTPRHQDSRWGDHTVHLRWHGHSRRRQPVIRFLCPRSEVDEPLAKEDSSGNLTYYHADALGSIVKTTTESGTVASSYAYDSFGRPTTPHAGGYAFTGREWDPETELHYYRARYYDPKIGRFLSEDPIGLSGGSNFYSYVGNSPASWIDPFGLMKLPGDPSGLGPEWKLDPNHLNPNGQRFNGPSGENLEFHKGQPGQPGWRGKDHWHHNDDKKHLRPGDEIPDPVPTPQPGPAPQGDSKCSQTTEWWEACYGPICFPVECHGWLCGPAIPPPPPVVAPPLFVPPPILVIP
jgi:RHS repeat-associated protein